MKENDLAALVVQGRRQILKIPRALDTQRSPFHILEEQAFPGHHGGPAVTEDNWRLSKFLKRFILRTAGDRAMVEVHRHPFKPEFPLICRQFIGRPLAHDIRPLGGIIFTPLEELQAGRKDSAIQRSIMNAISIQRLDRR
jgi:hypothetical protein